MTRTVSPPHEGADQEKGQRQAHFICNTAGRKEERHSQVQRELRRETGKIALGAGGERAGDGLPEEVTVDDMRQIHRINRARKEEGSHARERSWHGCRQALATLVREPVGW